jgi:hypothetical protein
MKKLLVVISVVALLGFAVKRGVEFLEADREAHLHRTRVTELFKGMQEGGNYQTAICMWYQGTLSMDAGSFPRAADHFDAWRTKQGFDKVKAFTVGEVAIEVPRGTVSPGSAKVRIEVDGRNLTLSVQDRTPIEVVG